MLNNKLPALEEIPSTEIIAANLKAIKEARKSFMHSESSEKLKRALRKNIRSCNDLKILIGDSVFYKTNNSKRWKGPGKVLGQDGQQLLIKHGSTYVRCHPCHVTLTREKHFDSSKDSNESLDIQQTVESKIQQTDNNIDHFESSDEDDSNDQEMINNNEQHLDLVNDNQQNLEIDSNKKATINDLKKHQTVKYLPKDSAEWKHTQIISRGGKTSGKYRGVWNTQEKENEPIKFIDFERDIQEFSAIQC